MTVVDRFETQRTADFYHEVVEPLAELEVTVDNVRHSEAAAELRADVHLPSSNPAVRTKALELVSQFEAAHGYTVAVLPALLLPGDELDD